MPTPNNLIAVTWSRQADRQTGTMGLATPNANWPLEYRTFQTRGNIVSARYQRIFSPSLVNEFVLGYNWRMRCETIPDEQLAKLTRPRWDTMRRNCFHRRTRRICCPTSPSAAFRTPPTSH